MNPKEVLEEVSVENIIWFVDPYLYSAYRSEGALSS